MTMRTRQFSVTPHGIARVTWVLVACGMVLYFSYHLWTLFSPPFLVLEQKSDIMTHDGFIVISGATQKESHVLVNGREIAVGKDGAFKEQIVLQDGMNVIEIKSINKFNKATTVLRRIIKQ